MQDFATVFSRHVEVEEDQVEALPLARAQRETRFAAFGLGDSDKSIATIDADGVALAAIQGLYEVVQEKDCRIEELEAKAASVEQLEAKVAALEALVNKLAAQQNGGSR